MKNRLLIIFLFPLFSFSQEYVDIFRINYGQTFKNEFKQADGSTHIKCFEAGFTLPFPINTSHAFITGADFSYNNLQLFPDAKFTDLYSTTLKLGMVSNWSEKWSTTIVLLPKLASNYQDISSDDFFMGGIAILKLKKKENLRYRFGLYASMEAYGLFTTPIFGWYYLSPNNRFEMDMSLPITADVSYKLGGVSIGMDYFGIGRSFNLHTKNSPPIYADLSSLEFAGYLQFRPFNESILLRTKLGYSSNDYEVYAKGDKIDLGISAVSLGDNRTQLNPSIIGSLFFRLEMIYRYDLKNKKENSPPQQSNKSL